MSRKQPQSRVSPRLSAFGRSTFCGIQALTTAYLRRVHPLEQHPAHVLQRAQRRAQLVVLGEQIRRVCGIILITCPAMHG